MPKCTSPIPLKSLPAELRRYMTESLRKGIVLRKFNATPDGSDITHLAPYKAATVTAAAAWMHLTAWKRARWIICASARNLTGYQLYKREHIEQKVPAPELIETILLDAFGNPTTTFIWRYYQPISPCSRRANDPAANPWDYTP